MKPQPSYQPIRFFVITFALTWIPGFISAFFSYQEGMEGVQLFFMIPGLFAPFIAALIMVSGAKNKELRKDLWDRLSLTKIRLSYLPAILLIMPIALFLATALSLLFGQSAVQFLLASDFKIMDGQVLVSVLILFLAPTFEELGWRGYGVDSIRSKFNLFNTTMIFAVLWGLWHVPLFFTNGYYQHGLWNTSIVYVINFFAQILVATILMNWVYYKNNRSISAAILFHFTFNLFSVLFQTEQFTKCIITLVLFAIAIVIIMRNQAFFFDEKPTIPALSLEPKPIG
jgi:membrane protease YdiL (CAAX protease family)